MQTCYGIYYGGPRLWGAYIRIEHGCRAEDSVATAGRASQRTQGDAIAPSGHFTKQSTP